MPKTVPGRAISQAEIDQRWREARRHLDAVEALLVPGIRTTRWWVHLRLYRLKLPIRRPAERNDDDRGTITRHPCP